MKLESIVALVALLAVVGLAAGAADFEAAEQRAVECCAKIKGPVALYCGLGVTNANIKLCYEINKASGLVGPNGVSDAQKANMKLVVEAALPALRNMGLLNSTGCISKWQDHSDCCSAANIPSVCWHLCDYSDLPRCYEEGDFDKIAARNADIFGQCWPYIEAINECSYAD